jgi:hypothetical protein
LSAGSPDDVIGWGNAHPESAESAKNAVRSRKWEYKSWQCGRPMRLLLRDPTTNRDIRLVDAPQRRKRQEPFQGSLGPASSPGSLGRRICRAFVRIWRPALLQSAPALLDLSFPERRLPVFGNRRRGGAPDFEKGSSGRGPCRSPDARENSCTLHGLCPPMGWPPGYHGPLAPLARGLLDSQASSNSVTGGSVARPARGKFRS